MLGCMQALLQLYHAPNAPQQQCSGPWPGAGPRVPAAHLHGVQRLILCVEAQLDSAMCALAYVLDDEVLVDEHIALQRGEGVVLGVVQGWCRAQGWMQLQLLRCCPLSATSMQWRD